MFKIKSSESKKTDHRIIRESHWWFYCKWSSWDVSAVKTAIFRVWTLPTPFMRSDSSKSTGASQERHSAQCLTEETPFKGRLMEFFACNLFHLTQQHHQGHRCKWLHSASAAVATTENVMNLPYQDFKDYDFPAFADECEGRAAGRCAKCCCDASSWCEHTRLTHPGNPEGNDLLHQILPRLIPWGPRAEAGVMLGYQSVFLPFFPLLFLPSSRCSA